MARSEKNDHSVLTVLNRKVNKMTDNVVNYDFSGSTYIIDDGKTNFFTCR